MLYPSIDRHLHTMEDRAKAFMEDIDSAIRDISSMYSENPRVSTMTVMCELCVNRELGVNLQAMYDMFIDETTNPPVKDFIKCVLGREDAIDIKKGKHFNNSLLFNIILNGRDSKQSVKLFCNGNLHITGFKTLIDILEVADVFATMFEIMHGESGMTGMFCVVD